MDHGLFVRQGDWREAHAMAALIAIGSYPCLAISAQIEC
jgi:hypothetical protein